MSDTPVERFHHPYSPSTLQNLEVCPCYVGKQSEKVHVRTAAGTRAHDVVETGKDDAKLGDDDALAAAECLDFVESRRQLLVSQSEKAYETAQHLAAPDPEKFAILELKETYLPVDDLKFDDADFTTAGYADRILVSHDKTYAEVFDWKFGFWEVEDAANNLQGIAYVLGVFKMFPTVQVVRLFFKQPHLELTSQALFTREQIPALYLRVQVVVAKARESRKSGTFETARPHVPVCNFCAHIGRCPKVTDLACRVGHKFYPLAIPADVTPNVVADVAQTEMGLKLAQVLLVWCGAFKRQVTDRILRGEAPIPPGQKIQEMQKRQVVDLVKLKETALRYMTPLEYESTLDTTFGALEEIVSEHAPRGSKSSLVEDFGKALLDSGAVKLGDKFSFLRSIPQKKDKTKTETES